MEKITKAEFARLLTQNKSALLYSGLKRKEIEWYFDKSKEINPIADRTATAKGMHLVFSNNSHLYLADYRNNKFNVSEFYKDEKFILSYHWHKAGENSTFDTESILLYYIEQTI